MDLSEMPFERKLDICIECAQAIIKRRLNEIEESNRVVFIYKHTGMIINNN